MCHFKVISYIRFYDSYLLNMKIDLLRKAELTSVYEIGLAAHGVNLAKLAAAHCLLNLFTEI